MLLGFTSLRLTVSEKSIANICIPKGVGETLIPCASIAFDDAEEETKCAEQVSKLIYKHITVSISVLCVVCVHVYHQ